MKTAEEGGSMTREELTARLAECEGHTPGPWTDDMGDIKAADDSVVATVWGRATQKTTDANIALFLLSPALVSALREAWAEIDRLKAQDDFLGEALNSGDGSYKISAKNTAADLAAAEERGRREGAKQRFPREPAQAGGWTIQYNYLDDIRSIINKTEYLIGAEEIEQVLLAVEQLSALLGAKEAGDGR